jgi:hypothetical protein
MNENKKKESEIKKSISLIPIYHQQQQQKQ